MRVVFMGTPEYAVPVLAALIDDGHDVPAAYTQPDRRRGRGRKPAPPAVKTFAEERGVAVFQPESLRDAGALAGLRSLAPDLIVVAAYGLLLPPPVLALPRRQALNVHPSLLPRYRGASPVSTAILDGAPYTGVTVMLLDEGLDSGPIAAQEATAIGPDEHAGALTRRLFAIGARLITGMLPRWERGDIQPEPQDESQATVTRRLTREDGLIDWTLPAAYLARKVRAHDPWPGSYTRWNGRALKIVRASFSEAGPAPPGVVTGGEGAAVGAADGLLSLETVQLEGGRAMGAAEFVRGHAGFVGARLG